MKKFFLAGAFVLTLILNDPSLAWAATAVPADIPAANRPLFQDCLTSQAGDPDQNHAIQTCRAALAQLQGSTPQDTLNFCIQTQVKGGKTQAQATEICTNTQQAAQDAAAKGATDQSQLAKECTGTPNALGIPGSGYALCYLGGVVVHALDGIFSLDNIFWLLSVLSYATFRLSGILLGIGIWWLDGAVYYTVVLMGAFISYDPTTVDGKVQGIKLAWSLVRDIANIAIIAGFVAVGISTILNIAQYAADKFLARLIIAALLVNFSYFITGAIIDATNYVSVQIYYSDILKEGCPVGAQVGTVSSPVAVASAVARGSICSIGSSFMKHSNLSSWDKLQGIALTSVGGQAGADGGNTTLSDNTNTANLSALQTKDLYYWLFVLGLLGTIFNLVAGFVFIMAAGLLIIRFAALIIVLVTSPIGIAGVNVPYIDAYVERWWSALGSQAVFAPIYFILVGIGLLVMKDFATFMETNGKSFADALGKGATDPALGILTGNLPIFIVFFVGIAFMYLALFFARQIASSVPELKGFYDMGQNYLWSAGYLGLPKLGQMAGGVLLRSTVIPDLEDAAARKNPRSFGARTYTGLSGLLRGFDKIGVKQKEGAKSSAEEAGDAVKDKRNNRYAPDLNKTLSGTWMQYLNPLSKVAFWKKKGQRTPEEDKKVKEAVHGVDKDKINETFSESEVNQGLKHEDFTDDQKKAIFNSHGYSEEQKHGLTNSFMEGKGFKVDPKTGKIDSKDAAKRFDTLTQIEKDILLAERKELLDDGVFLSALKSKNYDDIKKGESLESRTKMDGLRHDGLARDLRTRDTTETPEQHDKRVKDTLDRMSDDDIRRMKPEHITDEVLSRMKPSQAKARYDNEQNEAERKRIAKIHPHVEQPSLRPKQPEPEPEPTKPKGDEKK